MGKELTLSNIRLFVHIHFHQPSSFIDKFQHFQFVSIDYTKIMEMSANIGLIVVCNI